MRSVMKIIGRTFFMPSISKRKERGNMMKRTVQLSDHFTYGKLLRFVIPSIVMMIFTSIYTVVDGLFISNFVGKTPFAAVNLIIPFPMVLGSFGFMLGTGGSALVAKTMGEGKKEKANQYFSLMVYASIVIGVLLAAVGLFFMKPMAIILGAEGEMLPYCVSYGRILMLSLPMFMLQNVFQSFFVTAEKPGIGLGVTVLAGVTNMMLDALLMAVLPLGVAGAAAATAISQCVGGLAPILYFYRKNSSLLRLTKTRWMGDQLLRACSNGMSELISNVSRSLVSMLYNFQLMRIAGENGVAAYGVIMYVNFIFAAIFLGYSIGTAPIFSFQYGAENNTELKNVFQKSLKLNFAAGVILTGTAVLLASPLAKIFVGYDAELFAVTVRGFRLYAISFLLCGFSIFGSAFFTALNDGVVSAVISFLRTVVFEVLSILILPFFWGLDGVWYSISVAEGAALIVTAYFFITRRRKYRYA